MFSAGLKSNATWVCCQKGSSLYCWPYASQNVYTFIFSLFILQILFATCDSLSTVPPNIQSSLLAVIITMVFKLLALKIYLPKNLAHCRKFQDTFKGPTDSLMIFQPGQLGTAVASREQKIHHRKDLMLIGSSAPHGQINKRATDCLSRQPVQCHFSSHWWTLLCVQETPGFLTTV